MGADYERLAKLTREDLGRMSEEELQELFGPMIREAEAFAPGRDASVSALTRDYERLRKQHPNKWVAYVEGELRAVTDSHDALLEATDSQGIERRALVTEFIADPPRIWTL
jgi:hypothetical protein